MAEAAGAHQERIVCWNYLYLTQQIGEADSVE
jgi:hypothetical protein